MPHYKYLRNQTTTQPYRLLPLAIFAFFILCFALHPLSPLRTGQFFDPDDLMRLSEVINWLQGQGWFDLSQPRMSVGAHTIIHWSRLVDLPIALVMQPFLFMGMQNAALIASWIVPPVLFGFLLWLIKLLTRDFVDAGKANLSSLLVLFAPMVVFNFSPSRVDHHSYEILIAGFGVFCLTQILQNARGWIYAIASAVTFACGLWIGTEGLPWVLLFLACLGLCSAWQGGKALRNAAIFGVSFAIACIAVMFAALPVSEFSNRALSWFSAADVILAALSAVVLIMSWLLGRLTANKFLRCALVTSLGLFAAVILVWLVPEILNGPFADYDDFNSTIALDTISEAQPLYHSFFLSRYNPLTWERAALVFIHDLFLPLTALCTVLFNLVKNRARLNWLIHGVFLSAALLLTVFWQVRVGYFMELFSIAPLTWLLCAGWNYCERRFANYKRFYAGTLVFLLLGPLPILLIPALADGKTLFRDVVLFPAARDENSCNLKPAAEFLSHTYRSANTTVMAGMNEGPELLFRTPLNVIGGNFNVPGNADVYKFFKAIDEKTPQTILRKWQAKLVLVCRHASILPADLTRDAPFGKTAFLQLRNDGKLHIGGNPLHPSLQERLINGPLPRWLKPVEIPGNSDYLLFEIVNHPEAK